MRRQYRAEPVRIGDHVVEQFVLPITGGRRVRVPATWPTPAASGPPPAEQPALFDPPETQVTSYHHAFHAPAVDPPDAATLAQVIDLLGLDQAIDYPDRVDLDRRAFDVGVLVAVTAMWQTSLVHGNEDPASIVARDLTSGFTHAHDGDPRSVLSAMAFTSMTTVGAAQAMKQIVELALVPLTMAAAAGEVSTHALAAAAEMAQDPERIDMARVQGLIHALVHSIADFKAKLSMAGDLIRMERGGDR